MAGVTRVSWIGGESTSWSALLAQQPALAAGYQHFYRALWQGREADRRLLELTRLRIAAIHDCDAEWRLRDHSVALDDAELQALRRGDPQSFSATERAALRLAERMPFDHHGIDDQDVQAARDHLGEAGTVHLLVALAFFDATCRMKLISGAAVGDAVLALADPPLHDGRLA